MFAKKNRLRKNSDIQATFSRGRGFLNHYFSLKHFRNGNEKRFTVVVSNKVSKKAVVRNRLKRLTREFLKINIDKFALGDYVVNIRIPAAQASRGEFLEELQKICLRVWSAQ